MFLTLLQGGLDSTRQVSTVSKVIILFAEIESGKMFFVPRKLLNYQTYKQFSVADPYGAFWTPRFGMEKNPVPG